MIQAARFDNAAMCDEAGYAGSKTGRGTKTMRGAEPAQAITRNSEACYPAQTTDEAAPPTEATAYAPPDLG